MNASKSPAGPGQFNCYCGKTHPIKMLGRSFQDSTHDTPVTRPDLDALIHSAVIRWEGQGGNIEEMLTSDLLPILAAERARADQAKAALEGAWDEGAAWGWNSSGVAYGDNPYRAEATTLLEEQAEATVESVKEWRARLGEGYAGPGGIIFDLDDAMKPAAPTAEQGADQ
jgi:hypothetical protein